MPGLLISVLPLERARRRVGPAGRLPIAHGLRPELAVEAVAAAATQQPAEGREEDVEHGHQQQPGERLARGTPEREEQPLDGGEQAERRDERREADEARDGEHDAAERARPEEEERSPEQRGTHGLEQSPQADPRGVPSPAAGGPLAPGP